MIRRRKAPAPKKYRVVFYSGTDSNSRLLESIDVPGVFKTRAAGLKALRSAKTPEQIKSYSYRVSLLRERAL